MAVQSDGKIVAAGAGNGNFAVMRLNTNATYDTSFDGDGKVITDVTAGAAGAASTAPLQAIVQRLTSRSVTRHGPAAPPAILCSCR